MTMKTPEMEVVRFNESDVIVASGNPVVDSFTLSKFNNGTTNDGTVNGLAKADAINWLHNLGEGHTFQYKNNDKVSARNLYDFEETGDIEDGIYYRDGETNWLCQ